MSSPVNYSMFSPSPYRETNYSPPSSSSRNNKARSNKINPEDILFDEYDAIESIPRSKFKERLMIAFFKAHLNENKARSARSIKLTEEMLDVLEFNGETVFRQEFMK